MTQTETVMSGKMVRLREKRLSDARHDYEWQTDPELSALDAVLPLDMSYSQYLLAYEGELRFTSPTRRQFAIETFDSKHIGNCVYYDIREDKGEAELGIMIGDRRYWGKGYGTDAVNTLVDYIFSQLHFRRIYLKTQVTNARAQKSFKKSGFAPYATLNRDDYSFILMELSCKRWEEIKKQRDNGSH